MKYDEVPDVTLKMIIESGIIKPDTKVYASLNYQAVGSPQIIGNLNKDGSISFYIDNQLKTFPFPSGAARAIAKISVNGWIFWKILDSGQYKELSFFKEKYLRFN